MARLMQQRKVLIIKNVLEADVPGTDTSSVLLARDQAAFPSFNSADRGAKGVCPPWLLDRT
jgi:hypothetical protein